MVDLVGNDIHWLAEWETQSAVMLTWPHDSGDWGDDLTGAESDFTSIVSVLARYVRVLLVCRDKMHLGDIKQCLLGHHIPQDPIVWAIAPSDDIWTRDYGPLSIYTRSGPKLIDFEFDGWGGKYPAKKDNAINSQLQALGVLRAPMAHVSCVLEGGAVDSDGLGSILAGERCLIESQRNPGWTREDYERLFSEKLGTTRVLWISHGMLPGDDTDGHVDTLARFISPDTIVYQAPSNVFPSSVNDELQWLANQLGNLRTFDGKSYRLVALPCAEGQCRNDDGWRPAGYVNFLFTNQALLIPAYGATEDEQAKTIFTELCPEHNVHSVSCSTLIRQGGSLHCAAMPIGKGCLSFAPA